MSQKVLDGPPGDQSPSSTIIKLREVDPDEGRHVPKNRHVSADTILRYFDGDLFKRELDDEESLFGLLSVGVEGEVGMRFTQLARELGVGYVTRFDLPVVESIRLWLRDLFTKVL
jgi:hypothetical protein